MNTSWNFVELPEEALRLPWQSLPEFIQSGPDLTGRLQWAAAMSEVCDEMDVAAIEGFRFVRVSVASADSVTYVAAWGTAHYVSDPVSFSSDGAGEDAA